MQLAHDYFMKHGNFTFIEADVEQAWLYADLMFEQLEKRNIKDLDCKETEDIQVCENTKSCISTVEGFTVNWDNLPEWAEWFAVDRDGCCYIYSYEPQIQEGYDYWAYFYGDGEGMSEKISYVDYVKDWKNTLTKRPSL